MKMKMKTFVQRHHLSYDPGIITRVFREEHFYITKLDRFKSPVSIGLLRALKWFVLRHNKYAIDLDRINPKKIPIAVEKLRNKSIEDEHFHTERAEKKKQETRKFKKTIQKLKRKLR